ncbi:MAG: glycosyltransferase family 2 protein [Pseudomonadota bacterium]
MHYKFIAPKCVKSSFNSSFKISWPCTIISIVIPTHNRPQALDRSLASIFNQLDDSMKCKFQIIVVNDGSHTSYEQQKDCFSKSVVFIDVHPGRGVSNARNVGAKFASGKWILFLDDDDEFKYGYLKKVLTIVESGDGNLFDFLWSSVQENSYSDGRCIGRKLIKYHDLDYNRDRIKEKSISVGASYGFMVRRSIFENLDGFDTSFSIAEDTEFIVRLLTLKARPKLISTVGVIKHQHNQGRLSENFMKYSSSLVYEKIFLLHSDFFRREPQLYASLLYWSAKVHFESGNFLFGDACVRCLLKLIFVRFIKVCILMKSLIQIRSRQFNKDHD